MKRLVLATLVSVFMFVDAQAGYPWGCPWMSGSNLYGIGPYSRNYRTWQRSWNGGMFNRQIDPRNSPNWGMSQRNGIPYNELTPDQQKTLDTIDLKYGKKILRMEKELQAKYLELESLQLDDELDVEAIDKKQKEIEKAESSLDKMIDEYRAEVTKKLPETVTRYFNDQYDWRDFWTGPGGYCPMWR